MSLNSTTIADNDWRYLYTDPFKTRYAIAAWALRNVPVVIEIGGYKNCFDQFCNNNQEVHVIDPFIQEYHACKTHHYSINIQDWKLSFQNYGLCILGMELHLDNWQIVYDLINNANLTVIEIPIQHKPSVEQFNQILENTKVKIKWKVLLDLNGNEFEKTGAPPICLRQIYVLSK